MQKKPKHPIIIIYGPTGVGKTEIAERLGKLKPIEIINMDVGQLYTPLTIGTAKPDWRSSPIQHHLFDIIDEPRNYTVVEYRAQLIQTVQKVWERNHYPVVVGGSGFYLNALFFPPISNQTVEPLTMGDDVQALWQELNAIDPERATAIGNRDLYRIKRALALFHATGRKPSSMHPSYQEFPGDVHLICLTRDRSELYSRINERVLTMMKAGWLDEVKKLRGTDWEPFLQQKKLIGYNELLDYCAGEHQGDSLTKVVEQIQQRTRHYAKRQLTFWRMLAKNLDRELAGGQGSYRMQLTQVNLTTMDLDLYINQLSHVLKS